MNRQWCIVLYPEQGAMTRLTTDNALSAVDTAKALVSTGKYTGVSVTQSRGTMAEISAAPLYAYARQRE